MTPLLEARRVTKIFGGGLFERSSVVAIENFSLAVDAERPLITAVVGARPGRSVHLRRRDSTAALLGLLRPIEPYEVCR